MREAGIGALMMVQGLVQETRCAQCGALAAAFTFSGDTDMVTNGLGAAACGNRKLALGALTPDELQAGELGLEDFAERAARQFGDDFRSVRVKRYQKGSSLSGTSFAEFRRSYQHAQPIYLCRVCGGDAQVVAARRPAEFESVGGTIHLLGEVGLAQ
jgi:hypothetical protein